MANTKLTRTPSSAGNRKTFTISLWFQISGGGDREIIGQTSSSYFRCMLKSDETMRIYDAGFNFITNRKFTDKSNFYHLVIRVDTTQSTANDRVRVYINGVDERTVGGYSTDTAPSQNQDLAWNTTSVHQIGGHSNNYDYFNGVISHIHHCDGYSYAPTEFGETDSTTSEWKIKTSPSVSYGTNGFFILKDGNSVTDQSGQGNNFTVASGTLTKTETSPSNVFTTLDAMQYKTSALTYSNGNNTVSFPSAWVFALSQWGVSSGKYYWEAKCNSGNNANSYFGICAEMVPTGNGFYNNSQNGAIMYKVGGGETYIDASYNSSGYSPSINNTDIVGLALDLDSGTKTLKIYKNGTQLTTGGTINLSSYYNDTLVFPCFSGNSSSASCSFNVNFGSGYFGTQAVSSNSGNGYSATGNLGIFQYQPPTGYTALCTKGLNL